MKNIRSYISYVPKRVQAGLIAIAVFALPAVAFAGYAPANRPTYTVNNPAQEVVFNSITDNPHYGDERPFYDVKKVANVDQATGAISWNDSFENEGGFSDSVSVSDGDLYMVRAYVHNNASSDLNGENLDGPGVAKNTTLRFDFPEIAGTSLRSIAYVNSPNASPTQVSDTVDFHSETPFKLSYFDDSTTAFTNAVPAGYSVSPTVDDGGALIGYTGPNGVIPGCFEYDMIVVGFVSVESGTFTVNKEVRKHTTERGGWTENVDTEAGDLVDFQIAYKNNTVEQQDNVVVVDELPAHLSYVPGSTRLINGNNPSGVAIESDSVVNGGIEIGDYAPGAAAYVIFTAKVEEKVTELECGENTLTNIGWAIPEGSDGKKDTASVSVDRGCTPPPPKTPQPPTKELPNTGVGSVVGGFFGISALGTSVRQWIVSRRGLKSALTNNS